MIKLLLIIEAYFALVLGGFVLANNPKATLNRLYAAFSFFSSAWLVSNAFSVGTSDTRILLFFGRLITPAALLTTCTLFFFLRQFARSKFFDSRLFVYFLLPNLLLSLFSFTSWNTYIDSHRQLQVGLLFPAFVLILVTNILLAVLALFLGVRGSAQHSSKLKAQFSYMRYGFVLAVIPATIFGAVLPLFNVSALSNASPLFGIIFLTLTGVAVVRHSLFDIRFIVARTIAYLLLLSSLASVFATGLFALSSLFLHGNTPDTPTKIAYVSIALIMAILFQPLKRFFDKTTNSLFYRDAYDSQQLLNELNRSLVTTIDLEEILSKSAQIIGGALKTEAVTFAIKDSENGSYRIMGSSGGVRIDGQNIKPVISAASQFPNKVIVSDELETHRLQLKELMQAASIAVLVKLQGRIRDRTQHPGYIILGQKRSGGLYSAQDIQVLEIIADELVIAIQNALRFEEIQQFNITLQQKVEEATKELKKVNVRLRELDKTKDEFISMASHQLRTPLTTVKGYLSMILDGDVGTVKKDQKDLLQHAFDGANRMVYLIADLLNVSRLQTGKFVIDNKPTDLAEVIEGEVGQLGEQAANREIKLIYHKPDGFPMLNLDETKIRQVVMNFLDNALYYTPKGGSVTADLQATNKEVIYSVIDNGVGVPKAVQHHLFSKFYRADNARKMRPDGTGLGLYMAKKVISAQGGAIIFKSTEGKGSTFGFSFPRKSMEVKETSPTAKKPAAEPKPAIAKKA